jgi:hypothetical protein
MKNGAGGCFLCVKSRLLPAVSEGHHQTAPFFAYPLGMMYPSDNTHSFWVMGKASLAGYG